VTILSVAFPLLPVSSGSGGGAEQILYLLERGIAGAGHRSIVVAAKGSEICGDLIETPASTSEITDEVRREAQRAHLRAIERVLQDTTVDLIHFHGLDFYAYKPAAKLPMLATLHLPLDLYPAQSFDGAVQLNCVSQTQADSLTPPRHWPVVQNGIDTTQYNSGAGTRAHLLWLGRICPEKGVHIALRVAHCLDLPMIIAGPVHPFRAHQAYFAEEVRPLLDSRREYIGPVGLDTKVRLLSEAACLLIPSLVTETSSLVAMEATASGTPVVAFRCGALPEIVEHGITGFIVDSEEEMTAAVGKVQTLSPQVCRSRALERFCAGRMVDEYLALYRQVIGARAASTRPA
jgi:glycosyltransferase involved in cell wall biosynthesis